MDKGLIVRTAVLVYALVNNALVMSGVSTLPFADTQVEIAVSGTLTVVASLWTWYKNNSVTKNAKLADGYLDRLRKDDKQ